MGKANTLGFGPFPSVSIADAKAKRVLAEELLAKGIYPSEDKKDQKRLAKLNAVNTFEAVANE